MWHSIVLQWSWHVTKIKFLFIYRIEFVNVMNGVLDSRKGLTWSWNLLGPTCVAACCLSSWLGRNGLSRSGTWDLCFWMMLSHSGDAERMAILIYWVRNVQRMMSCSSDLPIMHVSGVRRWCNVWMEKPREIDDVLWMRLGRPCTSDNSHGSLHCQLMLARYASVELHAI